MAYKVTRVYDDGREEYVFTTGDVKRADRVQGRGIVVNDDLESVTYRVDTVRCNTCDVVGGGFGPPHDALRSCQSGKRNHCTCDTCF